VSSIVAEKYDQAITRDVLVVLQANLGNKGHRELPVRRTVAYSIVTSMDTDADAFSVDLGYNSDMQFLMARDVEVRANIFSSSVRKGVKPLFSGFADRKELSSDERVLSIIGRDNSCLATDSDAPPGRWRHIKPRTFIAARAHTLGMGATRIAHMSEIGRLYTDGSEKEWAFWYRIARMRKMWMWTEPDGTLIIDKLHYALKPTYYFGWPPSGQRRGSWLPIEAVTLTSSTQRLGEVWVYGQNAKTGRTFVGGAEDPHIRNWRRKPLRILASNDAKSNSDATDEAKEEIFESIVGSTEITLTIADPGVLVRQNYMAQVNLPELDIVGTYFIVGVQAGAGAEGATQTIRLREKKYALSKRVPDAPNLKDDTDASDNAIAPTITSTLQSVAGIRWADSFVRAALETGKANGWDTSLFLGVLMAMCMKETGFHNVRQTSGKDDAVSHYDWESFATFVQGHRTATPTGVQTVVRQIYNKTFANDAKDPLNPFSPDEAGVGPMQLTSAGYKTQADALGWNGVAKHDPYEGGRWNPDSNIRIAARALLSKLKISPAANPLAPDTIWLGVKRYNGSGEAADKYAADVRSIYESQFKSIAEAAIAGASRLAPGTGTAIRIPGHGNLVIPKATPDSIKKAINFCLRRLGDPYKYGGSGPLYDCSSLVTAAYAYGAPALKPVLNEPNGGHGETTYTLFKHSRFDPVPKDLLLPGDLVFFHGDPPEHVGMYLADDLFIHDPHTGDVVKISGLNEQYYRDNYSGARRLILQPSHPD
jgi:cell wall-associated NlpC family hydrolase/prophage tail gpP-like protein